MALGDIIGAIIGAIAPVDLAGLDSSRLLGGVPNVLGVYSMRLDAVGYSGPLIRLRRVSDGAEIDVGAASDGWLDESAVAAHCGASVGEISVWYDQSGAGNDAPAAGGRPLIWDGASVHSMWGRPAALCDGPSLRNFSRPDTLGMLGNPSFDVFAVGRTGGGQESPVYLGAGAGASVGCAVRADGNLMHIHLNGNLIMDCGPDPSVAGAALHFRGAAGDGYTDRQIWCAGVDGALVSSSNPTGALALANDALWLGGGYNMTGPLQTAIICSSPSPGYATDIATADAVRTALQGRKPWATHILPLIGWDEISYPPPEVDVGDTPGSPVFSSEYDLEGHFTASLSGPRYYVDVATGSDGNTGLGGYGNALRSVHAAVTLGNATGAPYSVQVLAGDYPRHRSFARDNSSVWPTQEVAFIADGRVTIGAFDQAFSWSASPDATYTTLYTANRSNVQQIRDRLNIDGDGDYLEYAYMGDGPAAVAAADAASGSVWASDGSTVYAKRSDAVAPTHTNSLATMHSVLNLSNEAGVSILLGQLDAASGFDLVGGAGGCLRNTDTGSGVVGAIGATFKFAGGRLDYTGGRGVAINNWTGLACFVDCQASSNTNDGVNAHGDTGSLYLMTIRCVAVKNGAGTSTSNNGITTHDAVKLLDLGGVYERNYGANVACIDSTLSALIDTLSSSAHGDLTLGGSIDGHALQVSGTAEVWCEMCGLAAGDGAGAGYAQADVGATLHRRRGTVTGSLQGAGTEQGY